jgi:hypothetical protein
MSNHSESPEMSKEFIESMGLGKTNQFPRGQIHATDEGEIKLAVGTKEDKVIIHFGTPVAWLGMYKEQAMELGKSIIEKAESL